MSETGQNPGGGGLIDRVKGTAKQVAGAVTGNDELRREGELHHDKADATKEAADLAQHAEREQEAAELTAREREIEIERQRLAAETAADAREVAAEQERVAAEQRIATETAQQEAAAQERARAEQQAAALEAESERAKQTAAALDEANEESA